MTTDQFHPTHHYGPGALQTYTFHPLPNTTSTTPPSNLWLIYIHGGAWRDALRSSLNVLPTLSHLSASKSPKLAGIISLNYRLSPYPTHPTAPSSPTDDQRNVKHPEHVIDIACAVRHVKKEYGIKRWVGAGHSCGATLLCHLVAGTGLVEDEASASASASTSASTFGHVEQQKVLEGLEGLVLLEGIYNIPILLRNHEPPHCSEEIAQIYKTFVRGAFGEEKGEEGSVYEAVSPTSGKYGRDRWKDGRMIFVAHSETDELVEMEQRDVLVERLKGEGWGEQGARVVEVKDLHGKHDEIWKDGSQIADLIVEMADRLSG